MYAALRRRETFASNHGCVYRSMRKNAARVSPDKVDRCIALPSAVSHVLGFTLDGTLLLCLGQTAMSILAFHYDPHKPLFQRPAFETHFQKHLARDFCIVTPNNKFLIVASATSSSSTSAVNNSMTYPHALTSLRSLDDISLFLLCARTGTVLDKLVFPADHILLAHAAGVQIYGDFMAVTSVKYQTVHLYHLQDSGRFVKLHEIGWLNYDDDQFHLDKQATAAAAYAQEKAPIISSASTSSSFVPASMYRNQHLSQNQTQEPTTNSSTMAGGPIRGLDLRRSLRRVGRAILFRTSSTDEPNQPLELAPTAPQQPIPTNVNPMTFDAYGFGAVYPLPNRPPQWMDMLGQNPGYLEARRTQYIPLNGPDLCDPKALPLSGLKQRMLAFLYRQALDTGTPSALRHFHLTFDQFANLVLWRLQFLSPTTLLLKLGAIENTVGRNQEPSTSQPCFHLIYEIPTTKVLAVFDNASQELLELFQSYPQFRHTPETRYLSTPATNLHAREYVKKQLYSVRKAKNGGVSQSVKRVLASLPINPHLYIHSPWLDQHVFHYDESVINNVNRPRTWTSGDVPVKIWDRAMGRVVVRIDPNPAVAGTAFANVLARSKKYVTYHFHPTDPVILTAMTIMGQGTSHNLHYRELTG
ncbi:hypothetical protein BCR33DRAFT_765114 [Rhizoclosmatium globosum]|uniref:Uncharacterized protein n=1 Tax=Rhizoclosmatium globosum TaxID=329046 RepID=A0A1Y2CFR0_9FUNG|nr:hypothetical protein BCR33DRAFT_765114 [Rhizoclosmatium globosum]|eukprot:ORY45862.1 hypothetical protein BCR33DRAFT_765114 [Rhizoclosmatium globosum]